MPDTLCASAPLRSSEQSGGTAAAATQPEPVPISVRGLTLYQQPDGSYQLADGTPCTDQGRPYGVTAHRGWRRFPTPYGAGGLSAPVECVIFRVHCPPDSSHLALLRKMGCTPLERSGKREAGGPGHRVRDEWALPLASWNETGDPGSRGDTAGSLRRARWTLLDAEANPPRSDESASGQAQRILRARTRVRELEAQVGA